MKLANTEEEARKISRKKIKMQKSWPCFLFKTDTSGEKNEEVFFGKEDLIIKSIYKEINVIKTQGVIKKTNINQLLKSLKKIKKNTFKDQEIKKVVKNYIKNFKHSNKSKSLEEKM